MSASGDKMHDLIGWLPAGDVQYVRDHETGTWSVGIFAPGTVRLLETVATGMDKGVALWLQTQLRIAREDSHRGK